MPFGRPMPHQGCVSNCAPRPRSGLTHQDCDRQLPQQLCRPDSFSLMHVKHLVGQHIPPRSGRDLHDLLRPATSPGKPGRKPRHHRDDLDLRMCPPAKRKEVGRARREHRIPGVLAGEPLRMVAPQPQDSAGDEELVVVEVLLATGPRGNERGEPLNPECVVDGRPGPRATGRRAPCPDRHPAHRAS